MINVDTPSTKLTPLQLELLKLYGNQVAEEDLLAIKQLIAGYFRDKLQRKVDKAVEDQGYTQADFDRWLNDDGQ
jgi:hypothetical protein